VPVIEVRDLRKSYDDVEAVRGISFEVNEGEVVAVLGPNGAGKTTTVEILEGFRHRDGGDVKVLGEDPEHGGTALRARIGIVLQELAVASYLTVTEIVHMYAEMYPHPLAVDEVVGVVGLTDKAHSRVAKLSGGQQRRLDLALALVGDPELLFLDEPTTGFDPGARRQAWEIVRELCQRGKTVLLTTHYMDEAQALADRVIVIAAGRIVAEGPPESLAGRLEAEARIQFRVPAGVRVDELPVEGATVVGLDVVVQASDPVATLHRLTGWALEHGYALDGLQVLRASLEDVYLQLVGPQAVEQ
jgi:ABC-2 type transport system ATP-binding protein